MNKIKILCLSFHTPPAVRPQAILIGKMIPEWIRQGLEPVIITYEESGEWDINAPVFKIKNFCINKFFNKIQPLREFFRYRYYKKLTDIIEDIAQKNKIDVIFSFAKPIDSNIVGAMLKKRLSLPFVSHFSDPWYDDPYRSFPKFEEKKVLWQENFIIKNSDKVIFTNETARKLVMKKYPESWFKKSGVIPHCFNLKDYSEAQKIGSDKFIISHIGAFYKKRNSEPLFQALKKIIDENPELAHKFRIELVGAVNDYAGYSAKGIENMAEVYYLKDNIKIIPPVSYEESLKYMKSSDCLVVIDADMPGSPFLPSKVVDYAGSGNTILGITPKGSPTAEFLKNLGYGSFSYDESDKLKDYLNNLISSRVEMKVNQSFLESFTVSSTTKKLISFFNEVLPKNS